MHKAIKLNYCQTQLYKIFMHYGRNKSSYLLFLLYTCLIPSIIFELDQHRNDYKPTKQVKAIKTAVCI